MSQNEVSEGRISALRFEKQKFCILNSILSGGSVPSAMSCNGIFLSVSFFGNGGVALFDIESDGAIGQRRAEYNSSKELRIFICGGYR